MGLAEQIAEIELVVASRERIYPGCIEVGHLNQKEADEHLSRMRAVLVTLRWLQRNEARIKAALR